MKGIFEILTEKKWMVSPDFVHGIRQALEHNLNTHAAFQRPEKSCGFVTALAADGSVYYPEEYQVSEDGKSVRGQWALSCDEQDFPFVSVLTVDGPITRNGGGCSYGSIDHRDMMINAANHPLCRGHIFLINTPGGSAWAKNDYEQAINYARSLGQPVIAFIDGMCASAGMYLASLCDERYYMHPKNEIGCIGVMAAFYTEADGSKNAYTNETYHELYDPESFEKNKAFRDIANDDNSEELINELAALGVEFRADVKKSCPSATDEHLHGKVFNAEDVNGILMDGQSTFADCISRAFALFNGSASPINREATTVPDASTTVPDASPSGSTTTVPDASPSGSTATVSDTSPSGSTATVPDASPSGSTSSSSEGVSTPLASETNTNSIINMENYPLINAACGLNAGEIAVKEEGAFMNAELLDALEAKLNAGEQAVADAEQKATTAETTLAELQGQFDELSAKLTAAEEAKAVAEKALADANEAHSTEIENLNAAHAEEIENLNTQIATVTEASAEVEKQLEGAKASLATAEQTIADKDAQIADLTNESGDEPQSGDAPANNGEGVQIKEIKSGIPQFDPANPVESKKAINAYLAQARKG